MFLQTPPVSYTMRCVFLWEIPVFHHRVRSKTDIRMMFRSISNLNAWEIYLLRRSLDVRRHRTHSAPPPVTFISSCLHHTYTAFAEAYSIRPIIVKQTTVHRNTPQIDQDEVLDFGSNVSRLLWHNNARPGDQRRDDGADRVSRCPPHNHGEGHRLGGCARREQEAQDGRWVPPTQGEVSPEEGYISQEEVRQDLRRRSEAEAGQESREDRRQEEGEGRREEEGQEGREEEAAAGEQEDACSPDAWVDSRRWANVRV